MHFFPHPNLLSVILPAFVKPFVSNIFVSNVTSRLLKFVNGI